MNQTYLLRTLALAALLTAAAAGFLPAARGEGNPARKPEKNTRSCFWEFQGEVRPGKEQESSFGDVRVC